MHDVIGTPQRSVALVSPYFVPTASGVKALADLRKNGIRVRVMTNAYEATDVPLVHAGYARHREALLQHGVELYEMQRTASHSISPRLNPLGSLGPACMPRPLRSMESAHLRRIIQFRPALCVAEHRLGSADRQPVAGEPDRAGF